MSEIHLPEIPEQRLGDPTRCSVDGIVRTKINGVIHQHQCCLADVDHVTDHLCRCGKMFTI